MHEDVIIYRVVVQFSRSTLRLTRCAYCYHFLLLAPTHQRAENITAPSVSYDLLYKNYLLKAYGEVAGERMSAYFAYWHQVVRTAYTDPAIRAEMIRLEGGTKGR